MNKHLPLLIAAGAILLAHHWVADRLPERLLQIPSGHIAAVFIGAPATFDGELIQIATQPMLTVSRACSGARLFSILIGLGVGYWCGRRPLRWLALLPTCYLITVFSNSVRITAAWHFRTLSGDWLPEWLQEFIHLGIGGVWSLTVIALLVYCTTRTARPIKELSA